MTARTMIALSLKGSPGGSTVDEVTNDETREELDGAFFKVDEVPTESPPAYVAKQWPGSDLEQWCREHWGGTRMLDESS